MAGVPPTENTVGHGLSSTGFAHERARNGGAPMKKTKIPPRKLAEWIEFGWLLLTNPCFQAAHDKRKAYFEYRLGKIYSAPCS
jgi:hypothetical protein